MHSLYEIKSKGIQTPISNTLGSFNIFIESKYFSQKVELIFINQNNNKTIDDWNWILKQTNDFIELKEDKVGWVKSKLWVNYLYAIEATDYGFEEIPISQMNIDFKIEEITILDDMPTANLETIRFNMNHFKIYKESQVFEGSKLEFVEFREGSIILNFLTVNV